MIGALNPSAIIAAQLAQPEQPFVWGQGGRRMTPDDIAREREIAASLMSPDYSPVASPWQGLARVSENLTGALRERKADKASQSNADYSAQIAQSLLNPSVPGSASPGAGQSPASGGNLMQVIADPYADPSVKALAQMQLEQQQKVAMKQFEYQNRELPEVAQLAQIANDTTQPEWMRKAAADRITAMNDPLAVIPDLGGGIGGYVGPRSQLGPTMERQLGQSGTNTGDIISDPRKQGGQSASPAGNF